MTTMSERASPASHAPKVILPYLDGWRGLAISLLLIGHFLPVAGFDAGAAGVNLFFVLSGLLMARLLFIDKVAIATFYRRRISRIFPIVYCFIIAVVLGSLIWGLPISATQVLTAATFTINYVRPGADAAVMPFGHIWSLCVEEHSYIVLSLIAVATRHSARVSKLGIGLAVLALFATGSWYLHGADSAALRYTTWLHSEVAAYGIFISALLALQLRGGRGGVLPLWVFALLVGVGLATHWWSVSLFWRNYLGITALALAVNLLERAPAGLQALLSLTPLRMVGLWSFSIYIWQQPFYLYMPHGGSNGLYGIVGALVVGVASYYFVEQPARRYLNERWGRRQNAQDLRQTTVAAP